LLLAIICSVVAETQGLVISKHLFCCCWNTPHRHKLNLSDDLTHSCWIVRFNWTSVCRWPSCFPKCRASVWV